MKEKIKSKHAITLLALIITVIILLILATVSMSLVMNSGVIDKANNSIQKCAEEEVREKVELIIANFKMDIGSNKTFTEYLEEEKNKNGIDDYILNDDKTITIKLNNYDIIVNQDNHNIMNLSYNNKKIKKSKIIGEIYTTDTSGTNARIKVISYTDNVEKEIKYTAAASNKQEFSNFYVAYSRKMVY